MKRLVYIQILLALISTISANAKWALLTKAPLIQASDVIVMADYKGHKDIDLSHGYNQLGSFTVVEVLKGEIPKDFVVYGRNMRICAPQISFQLIKPGRYMLCLNKRKFGWTDCNAFIQPIVDNKVLWFDGVGSLIKVQQELKSVIADIKGIINDFSN